MRKQRVGTSCVVLRDYSTLENKKLGKLKLSNQQEIFIIYDLIVDFTGILATWIFLSICLHYCFDSNNNIFGLAQSFKLDYIPKATLPFISDQQWEYTSLWPVLGSLLQHFLWEQAKQIKLKIDIN